MGQWKCTEALNMRVDLETMARLRDLCSVHAPQVSKAGLVRELIHRAWEDWNEKAKERDRKDGIAARRAALVERAKPKERPKRLWHATAWADGHGPDCMRSKGGHKRSYDCLDMTRHHVREFEEYAQGGSWGAQLYPTYWVRLADVPIEDPS